jgi:hypothetical protein
MEGNHIARTRFESTTKYSLPIRMLNKSKQEAKMVPGARFACCSTPLISALRLLHDPRSGRRFIRDAFSANPVVPSQEFGGEAIGTNRSQQGQGAQPSSLKQRDTVFAARRI